MKGLNNIPLQRVVTFVTVFNLNVIVYLFNLLVPFNKPRDVQIL